MKNMAKKVIVGLCLGMMAMLAGCGEDKVDSGKVTKGPVVGAKVFDKTGNQIGVTDVNGNFPLLGTGPYTTTGGTYRPLKADGTAGEPVDAPPMKAPVGVSQITPLSTLYQTAVENNNTAAITAINTLLATAGVTLSTDMSVKPLTTATNANGIEAILTLNESLGTALQQASTASTATQTAVTTALISSVTTLSTKTKAELTTSTATVISNAITTSITAAANNNTDLASISNQINSALTTAATGTDNLTPGAALPTNTGSTGGNKAN